MSDESILEYSEDVSEAEAPEALPAGVYPCTVRTAERRDSKSSGNPMIVLGIGIAVEDFPADFTSADAYPDGAMLTSYHGCADNARDRYRVKKLCEAFGVPASKKIDLNQFIGATASVTVDHEMWEGEARMRVKSYAEAD